MKSVSLIKNKTRNTPFFILILAIVFSYFYVDIGFAFKPYMILSIIFFLVSLKTFVVHRLELFEVFLILFFMYYCSTGFFAKYPEYSLRMILGVILILFCYFVMRYITSLASIDGIERSISVGGIIFNGLSLILYVLGLASLGFMFYKNGVKEFGVVVDRGFPRLIGIAQDPNVFSFYNLIFFFYYLTNWDKRWSKIGLFLAGTTMILTLSRGGIIAVLAGLVVMFLYSDFRRKVKMLIALPLFTLFLDWFLKKTINLEIFSMILNRFSSSDGGSGRSELWNSALALFKESPVFGIGIFNYLPYSVATFGFPAYLHNTFLDTLVEGGVIGFTLYLLVFIAFIITYINNRGKIMDNGYLLYTFSAMILLMTTYSLIVNEIFYLVLVLMWRYLYELKKTNVDHQPSDVTPLKNKKQKKRYRIVW